MILGAYTNMGVYHKCLFMAIHSMCVALVLDIRVQVDHSTMDDICMWVCCTSNIFSSDIQFVIGEERQSLYAHKCILAARYNNLYCLSYIPLCVCMCV